MHLRQKEFSETFWNDLWGQVNDSVMFWISHLLIALKDHLSIDYHLILIKLCDLVFLWQSLKENHCENFGENGKKNVSLSIMFVGENIT